MVISAVVVYATERCGLPIDLVAYSENTDVHPDIGKGNENFESKSYKYVDFIDGMTNKS